MSENLEKLTVAVFDRDILGLPGLVFDDGRVELFVERGNRLRLPAPAGEIIRDIQIRGLMVIEGGGKAGPDALAPAVVPAARKFRASIHPKDADIDPEFGALVLRLEVHLGYKLWALIHGRGTGTSDWDDISPQVCRGFLEQKSKIIQNEKVGLLIDSPGGYARSAYEIVRLFQRRTENLYTIVPLYAKSAATLLAIGGREIVMGMEAELGPLDVQIYDADRDEWDSALNAVQSFERLNAYALMAYDQAMILFASRTGKKPAALMPLALQYVTSIVGPMADKIDTFEVTSKARELKVAEDYAIRLMRPYYSQQAAQRIARNLVERYSTYSFIIDRAEAGTAVAGRGSAFNLGLNIAKVSSETEEIFTSMTPFLYETGPIIGRIEEVPLS